MQTIIIAILITIIVSGVVMYNYYRMRKRQKEELQKKQMEEARKLKEAREAEKRIRYTSELESYTKQIATANLSYKNLMDADRYLSNYDKYKFTSSYSELNNNLKRIPIEQYAAHSSIKTSAKLFLQNYANINNNVSSRNTNFVKNELKNQDYLLSSIEGKSLDEQQRKAVIVDEDNCLVVAGAGSGKTLTIAGKVKYLVERYSIDPSEILLISFTTKAAEEMRDRIKNRMQIDVPVKTFHKLGLDIISETKLERPSVFSLSHRQTLELFASFIHNAKQERSYFSELINYLSYDAVPSQKKKDDKIKFSSFKLKGEATQGYRIMEDTTTYKLVKAPLKGTNYTYREEVKSQEEVQIANFLFRNRIKYDYEERYQCKTSSKMFAQYKPDFYLPEYNIYIEHFGIDKNGNVPPWFKGSEGKSAKDKYNEGIAWKREQHRLNKTTLIETYSWENKDGILLSNLEKKLKLKGVALNPMTDDELWNYLQHNHPHEIDNFCTLIHTFLSLVKANNKSISELKQMAKGDHRALILIDLFEPIYKQYESYLKSKEEIDFNDMINMATEIVSRGDFKSQYKYIIIDEFQDISNSRYLIIKALLDKDPSTKLFCVGDDWQSIYRFAGSDIGMFVKFEKYFEDSTLSGYNRYTFKSFIEKTYRFNDQLINLSSEFIQKNENQIPKGLVSHKHGTEPAFTVLDYDFDNSIILPLHTALDSIAKRSHGENVSIKLLGRYTYEIDSVKKSRLHFKYNGGRGNEIITDPDNPNFSITFNTVHKAKGLEADYVILLNGNAGRLGFPSEIADDPLYNFLLSSSDQFPNGEERRVFYVALTRTRNHIYILSNSQNRSKFVDEICSVENRDVSTCDWCDSPLVEKKGAYGYFYACSNKYQLCNFTRSVSAGELHARAKILYNEKKYQEAADLYRYVISADSKLYEACYECGMCFERLGQLNNAIDMFNKALSIIPSHSNSNYWKASCLYDLRKYSEAAACWRRTNNSDSLYWYAKCMLNLSNFDMALTAINEHLLKNTTDKNSYLVRAQCFIDKKKFKDAYHDLLKAKKYGLNSADTYIAKYNLSSSSQNQVTIIRLNSNDSNTIHQTIKEAIKNNYLLQFNYQKSVTFDNGEQSWRKIKPESLEVIGSHGSVCVRGFCYLRNEERVFALSRISNLEIIK